MPDDHLTLVSEKRLRHLLRIEEAAKVVCNDYDLECEDCNGTLDKLKKTIENIPDKNVLGEEFVI